MIQRLTRLAAACGAAALLTGGAVAVPLAASAQIIDQNTLTNLLTQIGSQILFNNNVVGQQQPANTVVGYTQNGGTIYGDGRIVMPNGQTYYPNSNGTYPWGQPAYYSPNAAPSNYRYDYQRTGRWDRTHRHDKGNHNGWTNGRGNPHHDRDDGH